jgi:hypothetical protein
MGGNLLGTSLRAACPGGELPGKAGGEPQISRMKWIKELGEKKDLMTKKWGTKK